LNTVFNLGLFNLKLSSPSVVYNNTSIKY